DEILARLLEQRQVEVELAGEVLVEHRLAHPGTIRDLVHGRGVIATGDEHLLRGGQQLLATCFARQPHTAAGRFDRGHEHLCYSPVAFVSRTPLSRAPLTVPPGYGDPVLVRERVPGGAE